MHVKNIDLTFRQEIMSYTDSSNKKGVDDIKKKHNYHKNYYPEERSGICVVRHKGEDIEDLIKRFRKKFSKSGLAKELRDRMYYEKPSDKKRRKKMQSIRNIEREKQKIIEMKERHEKMKRKKAKMQAKRNRKEYKND